MTAPGTEGEQTVYKSSISSRKMIFGTDARAAGAAALFPLPLRDSYFRSKIICTTRQVTPAKKLSNCLCNGFFLIL
jgi:hypothetical protein